jgi:hypothetical protein
MCAATRVRSARGRACAPTPARARVLLVHLHGPRGVRVHLRLRDSFMSFPRPSARGTQSTPNSRVSSHSTAVAAMACRAPRIARTLIVSRARHLPSRTVLVMRAIWLWMWSWGSPSRLVPWNQEVTISSAASNRPGSRSSTWTWRTRRSRRSRRRAGGRPAGLAFQLDEAFGGGVRLGRREPGQVVGDGRVAAAGPAEPGAGARGRSAGRPRHRARVGRSGRG